VTVSRSSVTRFEVSERASHKGRGALIGLLVGALAGALAGAALVEECSQTDALCIFPREEKATYIVGGGVIVGASGAGVGALVAPGEAWRETPLAQPRLSLGTGARATGIQVAVSFGF
jgi:hypothetical protein